LENGDQGVRLNGSVKNEIVAVFMPCTGTHGGSAEAMKRNLAPELLVAG